MKIDELIDQRRYVKNTIDKFSKHVKASQSIFADGHPNVSIDVDTASQIAECLGCLKRILDMTYESIDVHDFVNPDKVFDVETFI